jgi:hypothetical protein
LRFDVLNSPVNRGLIVGRLLGISIEVFGECPEIRTCAEELILTLSGETDDPGERLQFFLYPLDDATGRDTPSGRKTHLQFINMTCYENGPLLSFHTKDGSFMKADVEVGRAWGYFSEELLQAPRYMFNDLFLAPLVEMLKARGLFGLHAAAVIRGGVGCLFPGGTASGKTTMALSLVKAGSQYAADDKVLLKQVDGKLAVQAFTRRFNIDPDIIQQFPELKFMERLEPLPGTEKRSFDISVVYTGAFIPSFEPKVIIHLKRTPLPESRIEPLSIEASFDGLLRQTVLSAEKGVAGKQIQLLADLAQTTESYLLSNGDDLYGAPERVLDLLSTVLGQR